MKRIFSLVFITLLLSSCSRPEPVSSLFRWEKSDPVADSLTVALEWAFIENESAQRISRLAASLDSVSRHGRPELTGPSLFWKARLSNREHHADEAVRLLKTALESCDSAKQPYACVRIRNLQSIVGNLNSAELHSALKEYEEYYVASEDMFMLANVSVDLGHIMRSIGDSRRGLSYYMKADSIYEALGIKTYHMKTSLNNASIFFEIGDTANASRIITRLLNDRKARSDRDFYLNVLSESYAIAEDTTSLLQAWKIAEKGDVSMNLARDIALQMVGLSLKKNDFKAADSLCRYVEKRVSDHTPLTAKAELYGKWAAAREGLGDMAEALTCFKRHGRLQDSIMLIKSAVEIGNIESRGEIARSEANIESRHQIERLWTWILVMSLVIVALLVAGVLMRKIQASRLAIARYHLDLERERRSLVSSALVMEEKDNVLESVLSEIQKMSSEGKLSADEMRSLEQNVKMHLSGRQDWAHFRELFDKVHPRFHKNLKQSYPELTEGDLRLATYIKAGMQGKQIARMLMLQPDTIRKNRQKLRRHLGLPPEASLEDFLRSIDSQKVSEYI